MKGVSKAFWGTGPSGRAEEVTSATNAPHWPPGARRRWGTIGILAAFLASPSPDRRGDARAAEALLQPSPLEAQRLTGATLPPKLDFDLGFLQSNVGRPAGFVSNQIFKRTALDAGHFSYNTCNIGSPARGSLVAVSEEDVPVFAAPSTEAEALVGVDGSPRLLDPRYDLKILEQKPNWVHVAAVSPTWPPGAAGWAGWIEGRKLLKVESEDERRCLFVNVFEWKEISASELALIHESVLQILHDDRRCNRIARGNFLGGGQRVYFTCYPSDGGRPYHRWLSSLQRGRSFTAPAPVDPDLAMNLCQSELQKALRQRDVVNDAPPRETRFSGSSLVDVDSVYHITMYYRAGEQKETAFCFLAPGNNAEITLSE